MTMIDTLHKIQKELKAPKGQENKFGGYRYRSCEDILEAVKPLLPESVSVVLSDELVLVGQRYYVKATARLQGAKDFIETHAFAREAENRKGFGEDQLTGAASSYARKYALNGLFCIDDTKDADSNEVKKVEDSRELTDAEDCKLRDFSYLLANCVNPVEVDSLVDEYEDFLSDLPKRYQEELNDEIKKGRTRGKSIPHVYHFSSAAKARDFYQTMQERIPAAKDNKILSEFMLRWDGKLKALDRQLGKKDEVSGMSPYTYLVHLYQQRIQPIAAE
jgi:hypothetical protein